MISHIKLNVALILVAILGLSVLWASTSLAAPPVAPYVTSTNGMRGDNTFTLSGTADPGTTIRILGGDETVMATTTFGGMWTAQVDVDEEDRDNLTISSTNAMGERSALAFFDLGNLRMVTSADDDDDNNNNDGNNDDNSNNNDDDDNDNVVTATLFAGIVYTQ